MQAKDLMSEPKGRCTPQTSLQDVAKLMVEYDCGAVPIVESEDNLRLIGIVTDRDIVVRCLARGENPQEKRAEDCMSEPVFSVLPDADEREVAELMEEHQVRRIPVVDENHAFCGIISQADIARKASEHEMAEILREVSRPSQAPRA